MKLFEWLAEWRDVIISNIIGMVDTLTDKIMSQAVSAFKQEIAMKSIDPEMFKDKDMKAAVKKLKESWKNSPESVSDIVNDLLNIVSGKVAQVQLESIAGIKIDKNDVISSRLFTQMAILTDITLLASVVEVVGSALPTTNLQHAGMVLKDYLNYSGLTQATGFGYGMMLSNVVSPLLTQELNQKVRPTLIDPLEAIRLSYRGLIPEKDRDTLLSKFGLSESLQKAIIEGFEFYPNPQDFIRFAVRDTFNDEIVKKYQYDNDYPAAIDAYVLKSGLKPEWMKHYWRAHWELPSANQAFEMLHRRLITIDDVKNLLRIADVAPYFIEPLIKTAYTPITRVDIRRLWNTGKYDKQWLIDRHLDIGYSPDNAKAMADFVSADAMAAQRDLSQAQILEAYNDGKLSAADAGASLIKMGYDDTESKLILSLEDSQRERSFVKREKNVLVKQYVKGKITEAEFKKALDGLKLSEREKSITVKEAQIQVKEAAIIT